MDILVSVLLALARCVHLEEVPLAKNVVVVLRYPEVPAGKDSRPAWEDFRLIVDGFLSDMDGHLVDEKLFVTMLRKLSRGGRPAVVAVVVMVGDSGAHNFGAVVRLVRIAKEFESSITFRVSYVKRPKIRLIGLTALWPHPLE